MILYYDHCYFPFKECNKAKLLPPFGKSYHTFVLLMPKYKHLCVNVRVKHISVQWKQRHVNGATDRNPVL